MGKIHRVVSAAVGAALICVLASNIQAAQGVDENMLLELKKMIEQQQQQLNHQAEEIAKLKEQLGGSEEKIDKKPEKGELASLDAAKTVTSSLENVDVNLYGHLNRGILWSDNGNKSDLFFVDNANSQSRLGINVSISPSEAITVGGRIEYGLSSNSSNLVNQNETSDVTLSDWNLRWADIFLASKSFGKVYVGYGSTASDGTAEIDLSGTNVVAYSDVEALSGGQLWYNSSNDTVTDVRVRDAFNNMDGLGREDRLRYDTPFFAGFSLATSVASDDAYDIAVKYSREFGDTKVAGAIAWSNLGDNILDIDNRVNGSFSVLLHNGLNATFAAGKQDMLDSTRSDATSWYTKLGYRVDITSLGKTSFSIDYGEGDEIDNNYEKGITWSVAAVQDIPSWGTEFYLAYRNYQMDTEFDSFDDVNAILGGARVKF